MLLLLNATLYAALMKSISEDKIHQADFRIKITKRKGREIYLLFEPIFTSFIHDIIGMRITQTCNFML